MQPEAWSMTRRVHSQWRWESWKCLGWLEVLRRGALSRKAISDCQHVSCVLRHRYASSPQSSCAFTSPGPTLHVRHHISLIPIAHHLHVMRRFWSYSMLTCLHGLVILYAHIGRDLFLSRGLHDWMAIEHYITLQAQKSWIVFCCPCFALNPFSALSHQSEYCFARQKCIV